MRWLPFRVKQWLYRLGQQLVVLNYVPGDLEKTATHDLHNQIQSLRHENAQLRGKLSAMRVKMMFWKAMD